MKFEIECAVIEQLQKDVIKIQYRNQYWVEIKDVKELNDLIIKIAKGEKIYSIMDTQNKFNKFSKEAQRYLAEDAPIVTQKILGGSAVVINNLPYRLLTKFFLNFYKPKFPMKIFHNEEQAIHWISMLKRSGELEKAS